MKRYSPSSSGQMIVVVMGVPDIPAIPVNGCAVPVTTKHKINNSNQFIYISVFIYRSMVE
jgi:hypothetical protein